MPFKSFSCVLWNMRSDSKMKPGFPEKSKLPVLTSQTYLLHSLLRNFKLAVSFVQNACSSDNWITPSFNSFRPLIQNNFLRKAFYFYKIVLFMYLFLAVLGLCCCVGFSSSCSDQGPLSSCSARASHWRDFSCCRALALGRLGFSNCSSFALEHWLSSCGAWA